MMVGYATEQKIGPWEQVGMMGVDAGLCWVGDPCYVRDGVPWGAIEQQAGDAREYPQGVCVRTGLGDGSYAVYVRRVNMPFWGMRVAEVKVVFISEEDLRGDEDDDR